MSELSKVLRAAADAVPEPRMSSGVEWCEKNVKLIGSSKSESFDSSITPWVRDPVEAMCGGEVQIGTLVKPVQTGGSSAGECVLCKWLGTEARGDVLYNWPDEVRAGHRWDTRFERILKACAPVMDRAPSVDRQDGKWKRCQVIFPHANFTMQGVHQEGNVDSDTIRFEVNEELHAWEPGRLAKAKNRTTAVWNRAIFNVSNASMANSDLHNEFNEGTQEHWETPCPVCGWHHAMRTEWDDKRPELGGLRYDAEGCRSADGYDYRKLVHTVRYQFPCGHTMRDDRAQRRELSQSGRYGAPRNAGAPPWSRSWTLEAVSADYIEWIKLIQEKHAALRAIKHGLPENWWKYLTERECRFPDPQEDRPVLGRVVVNMSIKKDRDGMRNRCARFAALDRQQGSLRRGEFPHWWMVVRDVDADGNSLLVWEGKCLTDEDAVEVVVRHGVEPTSVVVDSGDDTMHVYRFCLRHGFNAIKGTDQALFAHEDGGKKIFSPERFLYTMVEGMGPTKDDDMDEPLFWLYSKSGIRERLHWMLGSGEVRHEAPGDVSEDYRKHMESEELQERKLRKGGVVREWVQVRRRNDLRVCECYIAMTMEMAGYLGLAPDPLPASAVAVTKEP